MNERQLRQVCIITCSVFAREVETLQQEFWPGMLVRELNSMLHMRPELLWVQLNKVIDNEMANGRQVLLVYGDCCAAMTRLDEQNGISRTQALNCVELLLGKKDYLRMEHEGVFFLLPEWARRWKTIFTQQLGLSVENTRDLMKDMHKKLVYLDTGLIEVPHATLQACAEFTGLPYEILPVSLEHLKGEMVQALLRLNVPGDES